MLPAAGPTGTALAGPLGTLERSCQIVMSCMTCCQRGYISFQLRRVYFLASYLLSGRYNPHTHTETHAQTHIDRHARAQTSMHTLPQQLKKHLQVMRKQNKFYSSIQHPPLFPSPPLPYLGQTRNENKQQAHNTLANSLSSTARTEKNSTIFSSTFF